MPYRSIQTEGQPKPPEEELGLVDLSDEAVFREWISRGVQYAIPIQPTLIP